jgi:hypothetical protein
MILRECIICYIDLLSISTHHKVLLGLRCVDDVLAISSSVWSSFISVYSIILLLIPVIFEKNVECFRLA